MKFGPVPIALAQGGIAAHSIRKGGTVLKKGTVIGKAEIAALTAAGIAELVVAHLEQDDVPITPTQAAELDRRMETYEQDAAAAQPWDVVRKRIERNLP